MKVEIWSDVMCPFCYIGKRRFENALDQFANKKDINIQWKSFQLAPDLKTAPDRNVYDYLAEKKGWTPEYSRDVHMQMTATAKQAGLEYNFDKAIPANSLNAHRLSHMAAKHGLQDVAEERLFSAYFKEGQNIDDAETLVKLGTDIGLQVDEVQEMLNSNLYVNEVHKDIYEAQQVGVRGVPFFVFDNKYAVSGAQSSEVFLSALQTAWKEYENNNLASSLANSNGASCSIDGDC